MFSTNYAIESSLALTIYEYNELCGNDQVKLAIEIRKTREDISRLRKKMMNNIQESKQRLNIIHDKFCNCGMNSVNCDSTPESN